MPATTRSTRCASRPAAAPGAPSSGPTKRRGEAGLGFAVKLDKPAPFIGREALLKRTGQPLAKKLLCFVLDDPGAYVWGGEAIQIDGEPVGELSSAGWSLAAGACVGLGYVRGAAAQQSTAARGWWSTCGASRSAPPPGTKPRCSGGGRADATAERVREASHRSADF